MAWPCSSRCSISMSSFTPSTTICTSSTSEKPRRSALETSKTPPTAAVSTPPGETDGSAGLGGVKGGTLRGCLQSPPSSPPGWRMGGYSPHRGEKGQRWPGECTLSGFGSGNRSW
uniref:Uncharacterized protein n=1 Tax=Sus scrofa TaxID=9823 RepID=A0A4X1TUX7_PIG